MTELRYTNTLVPNTIAPPYRAAITLGHYLSTDYIPGNQFHPRWRFSVHTYNHQSPSSRKSDIHTFKRATTTVIRRYIRKFGYYESRGARTRGWSNANKSHNICRCVNTVNREIKFIDSAIEISDRLCLTANLIMLHCIGIRIYCVKPAGTRTYPKLSPV